MRSPARVEDRVSIVDMCTPVLALRNLEVDPVQTAVPLLDLHQLFPIDAPLPTVDLPSPSLEQNRQYRETVMCSPMQPEQELSQLRRRPVRSRCACTEVRLCVVQTELCLSVDEKKEEKTNTGTERC